MRTLTLLLLLATGCGSVDYPPPGPYHYKVRCLGPISAETPLSELWMNQNVDLLQSLFVDKYKVMPAREFCTAFADIPIRQIAASDFGCNSKSGRCDGHFQYDRGILVAREMKALAHELLHAWEDQGIVHGNAATFILSIPDAIESENHDGWKEKGYFDLDHEYDHEAQLPWLPEPDSGSGSAHEPLY